MKILELGLGRTWPATRPKMVVLIATGQSNEKGRNPGLGPGGGIVPGDIAPDARILQWPSDGPAVGTLITAAEPLWAPYTNDGSPDPFVGPHLPMAKALLAEMKPADRIVIVPLFVGGTGYTITTEWAVGNALHTNAIERLAALKDHLALHYAEFEKEWCFTGFSGEDDTATSAQVYLAAVKAGFTTIATAVGLDQWHLVAALMSPAWVSTNFGANAINSAKVRMREAFPRTAIVASPNGPYDPDTSVIHFNANAQVVRGQRLAAALRKARERTDVFDRRQDFCDGLSTAPFACYSLWRRLRAAYAGPLFQVTRSSDNATLDIARDGGGFADIGVLEAFCGASNGHVSVLYDQSGSGRNFASSGALAMPLIVSGGRTLWRNGRPMMGGNNGHLIAGYDAGPSGAVTLSGHFADNGLVSLFSSRGIQVFRASTAAAYATASHNVGTQPIGVSITAGSHSLMGRPALGLSSFLDGIEQAGAISTPTNNASYVGVTTLLARQVTAGVVTQMATDLLSEVIVTDNAWGEADRAILHAGLVSQYLPDPVD